MGKRCNMFPLCNIKSHFMTIDSRVLYGIMRVICPEFDVNREEFTGENRETYWKNIFSFKLLKASKQKAFTGMIETDGVATCVRYRRLKADRHVPPAALPSAKHEDEKEEDPATQEVEDNEFIVDADPGNTNIIAIAAPKCGEDGTDGNLRQNDMRLFQF